MFKFPSFLTGWELSRKNSAHKSRASSTTIFSLNMRRRYTGDTKLASRRYTGDTKLASRNTLQAEIPLNGKWPLLHKSLTLLEEFIIYGK